MAKNYWMTEKAFLVLEKLESERDRQPWIEYIELVKERNGTAILDALDYCIRANKPLPPWLTRAFTAGYLAGKLGEVRSWDEVFGRPSRFGWGERFFRRLQQEISVFEEISALKAANKKLSEEVFASIGKRLGIGSKTKVKDLWRGAKEWIGA